MIEFIIGLSFVLVLGCYLLISYCEKSYLNILTPCLLLFVPSRFILEFSNIFFRGYSGTEEAYFFCFVSYAATILAFTTGYFFYKRNIGREDFIKHLEVPQSRCGLLQVIFLGTAILIFSPVIIEFSDYILTPRQIYIQTRSGYGLNFFAAALLIDISFVFFLFSKRKNTTYSLLSVATYVSFLFAFGSKGQYVKLLLIYLLYVVYVRSVRVSFKNFILCIAAFSFIIVGLFAYTHNIDDDGVFSYMSGYSDYTRNAMLVIDDESKEYTFGALIIEDNVYSRIPRLLYEDKPKNFGTFFLAERYYPEWFAQDTGSPAFGIGVAYYDFGILSLFYNVFWGGVAGIGAKYFREKIKVGPLPGDFIMLLFFADVHILAVGAGYMIIEHLAIMKILNKLYIWKPGVRYIGGKGNENGERYIP